MVEERTPQGNETNNTAYTPQNGNKLNTAAIPSNDQPQTNSNRIKLKQNGVISINST